MADILDYPKVEFTTEHGFVLQGMEAFYTWNLIPPESIYPKMFYRLHMQCSRIEPFRKLVFPDCLGCMYTPQVADNCTLL